MVKKYLAVAFVASLCLAAMLFIAIPTRSSPGTSNYNPWADLNDDGVVDIYDAITLANAYDSSGTPLTKASLLYDSGWLDATGWTGQNHIIVHNMNLKDTHVVVDARNSIPGWNKTYGGRGQDEPRSVVQAGDGGYVLAGFTSSGVGYPDFWLVKTDGNGNVLWNKTYRGTDWDEASSVVQASDGGYVLAGYTWPYLGVTSDFWLVKTDGNGNVLWNKTYGGTRDDYAFSVVQAGDGGYVLAGCTGSFGAGYNFWLVKTDANGTMLWNKTYGGTSVDSASSVVQASDGGYVLTGYTKSFGAGDSDFWLIKTDVDCGLAWTDLTGNSITLYRSATDGNWNLVRVRIWKPKE